jgi:hypothetical protein
MGCISFGAQDTSGCTSGCVGVQSWDTDCNCYGRLTAWQSAFLQPMTFGWPSNFLILRHPNVRYCVHRSSLYWIMFWVSYIQFTSSHFVSLNPIKCGLNSCAHHEILLTQSLILELCKSREVNERLYTYQRLRKILVNGVPLLAIGLRVRDEQL